jgi:hypothetical protein
VVWSSQIPRGHCIHLIGEQKSPVPGAAGMDNAAGRPFLTQNKKRLSVL